MSDQPTALSAHLRRLSTDALTALVADVWAARGFETDRHGNTVIARSGGTRRIQVSGADDGRPVVDESTDIVVAPGGSDGVATRVIDADEFAQIIRYGIAVEERNSICKQHLGSSITSLEVPWQARAHNYLQTRVRPAVYGIGVLLCILIVASISVWPNLEMIVGSAGGPDESAEVARDGPAMRSSASTTASASSGDQLTGFQQEDRVNSNFPPGVGPGGIEDISQLDTAHSRAIGNRSYTLQVDLYWPRGGEPGAQRVHRNMDFRVGADGRYLLHTVVRGQATDSRDTAQLNIRVYHDGSGWFVAESTGDGVEYRRISPSQQPPVAVPEPTVLQNRLASGYLSTPETNVTTVSREAQPGYRLIGYGRPLGAGQGITNYSVRAFIRSDGLISNLSTRSTRRVTPPVNQRFRMSYDRFNATTVATPLWVSREFNGGSSS